MKSWKSLHISSLDADKVRARLSSVRIASYSASLSDVPNLMKDVPNFVKDVPRVPKCVSRWGSAPKHFLMGF